jgi:hypothetical protein
VGEDIPDRSEEITARERPQLVDLLGGARPVDLDLEGERLGAAGEVEFHSESE